jgi:hypothetical protein
MLGICFISDTDIQIQSMPIKAEMLTTALDKMETSSNHRKIKMFMLDSSNENKMMPL